MVTTAFLSMWMSNTAVAAMMLAIAHAVLRELEEETSRSACSNGGTSPQSTVKILYYKSYSEESGETNEEVSVEIGRKEMEGEGEREGREGEREGKEREEEEEHISLLGPRESGRGGEGRERGGEREKDSSLTRLSRVLVLGVAYAANIGGTATLTGTGPNIVLSGLSVRWAQFSSYLQSFLICIVSYICSPNSESSDNELIRMIKNSE